MDDRNKGESIADDTCGNHKAKLPAGHSISDPASSLPHHARRANQRRARLESFGRSPVRNDSCRLLLEPDSAIQRLTATNTGRDVLLQLTGTHHNLLRQ